MMPWTDKFVLIVTLALVTVLGTAAAVSHERGWNGTTIACLLIAILITCAMGAVTYYYHLHEDDETSDAENGVAVLMAGTSPRWIA